MSNKSKMYKVLLLIFNLITRCSAVGSAPGLGPGCREFESLHLDQKIGAVKKQLTKKEAYNLVKKRDCGLFL